MKLIAIIAILFLSGCEPVNTIKVDQCLRNQIFVACMKALPAGPASTKYNDWDEVVEACASAATYQSYRHKDYIKPECSA